MSKEPIEGHDTRRTYPRWVIGITAANLGLWLIDQWVDATPAAAVVSVASGTAILIAANAWSWPRMAVIPVAVVLLALRILDLLDNDLLPRIRL